MRLEYVTLSGGKAYYNYCYIPHDDLFQSIVMIVEPDMLNFETDIEHAQIHLMNGQAITVKADQQLVEFLNENFDTVE